MIKTKETIQILQTIIHNMNVLADAIKRINEKIGGVTEDDILGHKTGYFPMDTQDAEQLNTKQMDTQK